MCQGIEISHSNKQREDTACTGWDSECQSGVESCKFCQNLQCAQGGRADAGGGDDVGGDDDGGGGDDGGGEGSGQ